MYPVGKKCRYILVSFSRYSKCGVGDILCIGLFFFFFFLAAKKEKDKKLTQD